MKKRAITLLLVLAMVLSMAVPGMAAGTSGTSGTLSWSLENGTLTISGTGNMQDFSFTWDENDEADGTTAPWSGLEFDTLVVAEGVTSIGDNAFYGCAGLTDVQLPSTLYSIGSYAFSFCPYLTGVVLPEGVRLIEDHGFYASGIAYAQLPGSLSTIGSEAFSWCENLAGFSVADGSRHFSTDGVGLYNLAGTRLIQLPAGHTGSYEVLPTVTGIEDDGVFGGCLKVTSITLPSSVTQLEIGLFSNLLGLEEILVDEANQFYYAADGALYSYELNALEAVPPSWPGTEFHIPQGIEVVDSYAFAWCEGIEQVYIPSSVTGLYGFCFEGCTGLQHIWVEESNPVYLSDGDGVVFNRAYEDVDYYDLDGDGDYEEIILIPEKAELIQFPTGVTGTYDIPDGVQIIVNSSFSTCVLSGVTFPASVSVLHWWSMDYCSNLEWLKFTGDKPLTEESCLEAVTATVYYPDGNSTWADPEFPDCGGDLTYVPYTLNPFTDVAEGAFYYDAVLWAVENGVTNGITETTFAPNSVCNRGQVVTFLWRAAGSPEPASSEHPFVDVSETAFYYKAMLWAVEMGITNGVDATHFGPNQPCSRGQVVTFLWRAKGSEEPGSSESPFTDVAEGSFCYKAVLWAVENGITNGITPTTFQPGQSCNRGQVVTFLYRSWMQDSAGDSGDSGSTGDSDSKIPPSDPDGTTYILNTSTMKFHYPSCFTVSSIAQENYHEYVGTREVLLAYDYSPCGHCDP